jgi:hypothetical protein
MSTLPLPEPAFRDQLAGIRAELHDLERSCPPGHVAGVIDALECVEYELSRLGVVYPEPGLTEHDEAYLASVPAWTAALAAVDAWAAADRAGRDRTRPELTAELSRLGLDEESIGMLLGHHDARLQLADGLACLGADEDDVQLLLGVAEVAYSA